MPKQLNNGRVTQALQRAFGFKGRYIPMLDEVIVPVYQIADPVPSEPNATYFSSMRVNPDTAGPNHALMKFTNPAASGVLAQITDISVGILESIGGTKPAVFWSLVFASDVAFPPSFQDFAEGIPKNRDQRSGTDSRCQLTGGSTSGGVDANNVFATTLVRQGDLGEVVGAPGSDSRQPLIVLPPGQGIEGNFDASPVDADAKLTIFNWSWLEVPVVNSTL